MEERVNEEEKRRELAALVGSARKQIFEGIAPPIVESMLMDHGFEQKVAKEIVKGALHERRLARNQAALDSGASPSFQREDPIYSEMHAEKNEGRSDMLTGGLVCLIGIGVTAATYSAASSGGGSYVVAWGAILFGAVRFFRGLMRSE